MPELPFEAPLPWLWSCHHCHTRYPLGTTRRCLHDGHYFCGGTTVSPLTGKPIKRHRACGSEFDYHGWHDVLEWKGSLAGSRHRGRTASRSCETSCEYPTACRHEQRKGSNVAVAEARKEAQADRRVRDTLLDPGFDQVDQARSSTVRRSGRDQRNSQVSDIAAKATDSKPYSGSLEPSFPGPAVTGTHVMHAADNEEDDDGDSDADPDPSYFSFFFSSPPSPARTLEADPFLFPIKSVPTPDPIFTYPDPLDPRPPEPWLAAARVKDGSLVRFVIGDDDDDARELHEREVEDEWIGVGRKEGGEFVRFIDVTDDDNDNDEDDNEHQEDEVMMMEDDDDIMEVDGEDAARYVNNDNDDDDDDDDVEMMQEPPPESALLPRLRRC